MSSIFMNTNLERIKKYYVYYTSWYKPKTYETSLSYFLCCWIPDTHIIDIYTLNSKYFIPPAAHHNIYMYSTDIKLRKNLNTWGYHCQLNNIKTNTQLLLVYTIRAFFGIRTLILHVQFDFMYN